MASFLYSKTRVANYFYPVKLFSTYIFPVLLLDECESEPAAPNHVPASALPKKVSKENGYEYPTTRNNVIQCAFLDYAYIPKYVGHIFVRRVG